MGMSCFADGVDGYVDRGLVLYPGFDWLTCAFLRASSLTAARLPPCLLAVSRLLLYANESV